MWTPEHAADINIRRDKQVKWLVVRNLALEMLDVGTKLPGGLKLEAESIM